MEDSFGPAKVYEGFVDGSSTQFSLVFPPLLSGKAKNSSVLCSELGIFPSSSSFLHAGERAREKGGGRDRNGSWSIYQTIYTVRCLSLLFYLMRDILHTTTPNWCAPFYPQEKESRRHKLNLFTPVLCVQTCMVCTCHSFIHSFTLSLTQFFVNIVNEDMLQQFCYIHY